MKNESNIIKLIELRIQLQESILRGNLIMWECKINDPENYDTKCCEIIREKSRNTRLLNKINQTINQLIR